MQQGRLRAIAPRAKLEVREQLPRSLRLARAENNNNNNNKKKIIIVTIIMIMIIIIIKYMIMMIELIVITSIIELTVIT